MSPEIKAFGVMVGAVVVAIFLYEFASGLLGSKASLPTSGA